MLEKKGLVKLVEECGELTQVAAKKMTRMDHDNHWDDAGSLKERLENEMADVSAAMFICAENLGLNVTVINHKMEAKIKLFREWMREKDTDAQKM